MTEEIKSSVPIDEIPPHRRKNDPAAERKQKSFLIFLIIFVVVGAGFIFYRSGVAGGGSSQAPAEKYLNAIAASDFDAYVNTMPPKVAEDFKKDLDESGLGKKEFMQELYSDYFNEFGDDMGVTLEFNGRSRVESKYLESFKESYRELYREDIKITSAFEVNVSALFSGSKSKDLIQLECFVIKTGGKWYIAGCDYKTEDADEIQ